LPSDSDAAAEAICQAFGRAKRGERIEIGCIGGLGRTGTVLAYMRRDVGSKSLSGILLLTFSLPVSRLRRQLNPSSDGRPAQPSATAGATSSRSKPAGSASLHVSHAQPAHAYREWPACRAPTVFFVNLAAK
jgi:hypothetical protein